MARRMAWAVSLLLVPGPTMAAAPVVDHLFPPAVPSGSTVQVTATGTLDPWPAQVWTDAPHVRFEPESGKGVYQVTVPPETPPGAYFVRLYNAQGASKPKYLLVAREPQESETEPNDTAADARKVSSLPAWFNGRLNKAGDVDGYAVALEAGETLVASVQAYVLGSPLDAVLRVLDERGVQVAFNHDDGRTLDPMLAWTAPRKGLYVVQVFGFPHPANAEIQFTGGASTFYRIHLSKGPYLRHLLPLGVRPDAPAVVQVVAWNYTNTTPVTLDPARLLRGRNGVRLQWPPFENEVELCLGAAEELLEAQWGDTSRAPPAAVTGSFSRPGEVDRYRVSAAKGARFFCTVHSARLGFPLDPWIQVVNPAGKEVARTDDTEMADPVLEWTASDEGTYEVRVGNTLHRPDPGAYYRLSVEPAVPSFEASVAEDSFNVALGQTVEIKISVVRRHGFSGRLSAEAVNLPAGLSSEAVEIPESAKEGTLKVTAAAEAAPASGAFQIRISEASGHLSRMAEHRLTSLVFNNGVPTGFRRLVIESIQDLWITAVKP